MLAEAHKHKEQAGSRRIYSFSKNRLFQGYLTVIISGIDRFQNMLKVLRIHICFLCMELNAAAFYA